MLAAAIAVALTAAVAPAIPRTVFVFSFGAVTVAAWYGGVAAGALAGLVCVLGVDYFVIPPARSLRPTDPADYVSMAAFLAVAWLIGTLTEGLRGARAAAERSAHDARAAAADLERAHTRLQEHGAELEGANQQLQEQAAELEVQAEELQATAAHLEGQVREAERARGAAAEARALLWRVLEQAPVAVSVVRGPDHVFALANATYQRLAGGRPVLGRAYAEAFPEVEAQGLVAVLDRVYRTGEPFVGRALEVVYDRDGTGQPVRGFFTFVTLPFVEDGATVGLVTVATEVTEEVRARHLAEAARRDAEAASAAQGRFLATMSHEIRTPINAALGYAELMALGVAGPVTDQQRDYLTRLRASSRHLLGLVDDVLDLAKSDAGEMAVAREPGMTGPAVAAALSIVLPLAEAKGIGLVDASEGDAGVAYVGDEARVRQILVNLLTNAVKFTPPGGRVTVTCEAVGGGGPPDGGATGDGPRVAVRVEDTGVGIAPAEQARVFAPFHQVDAGHTRAQGGTGLGLAISRRLAQLMGGDLTVESTPGAGSTFTLWLPAGAAAGPSADAGPGAAAGGGAEAPAGQSPGAADGVPRGAPPRPAGLAAAGTFLRERLERVLEDYVARVRQDTTLLPGVRTMSPAEIEDHGITFLGDLAQSLVAIEQTGGAASDIVRDGTEIQRFISELHGRQRERLGWTEAQLARDYVHQADAIEATMRRHQATADEVDTAVRVLRQLVGLAAGAARRAFRHARHAVQPAGPGAAD